jgi:hypothetical protein
LLKEIDEVNVTVGPVHTSFLQRGTDAGYSTWLLRIS